VSDFTPSQVSAYYRARAPHLVQDHGHDWRGCCPLHGGKNPESLSVRPDTGVWFCQSGCQTGGDIYQFEARLSNLDTRADFPKIKAAVDELLGTIRDDAPAPAPAPKKKRPPARIVATYDYRDEQGNLLYQAVRKDPKGFTQRRPNPNGEPGWTWGITENTYVKTKGTDWITWRATPHEPEPPAGSRQLPRVRPVLYHLAELLAADPSETIFQVEGEKDVENLLALGLLATTNVMGAGKWHDEYTATLTGRHVVILQDNDTAGADHARAVANHLQGKAASVKVLLLPGLPEKGDPTDWLAAGGTKDQMLELATHAPEWGTLQESATEPDPLGRITVQLEGDAHHRAHAVVKGLLQTNEPPHLFQRERNLVRVVQVKGKPRVELLNCNAIRSHVGERLQLMVHQQFPSKDGGMQFKDVPTDLRKDLAEYVLNLEAWPFPYLNALVHSPTFAPSGQLITAEGYNEAAMVYLWMDGFKVPDVPARPTAAELAQAKAMILDDLLGEFPFADEAGRAHAVALGLLPFVRLMVQGPTPLHLISAPAPGTGKSLLAKALGLIATGREPEGLTEGRDDDEWRKRITSTLERTPAAVLLDNLNRNINSGALASVLTSELWQDRRLGTSTNISVPNLAAWSATANNPEVSNEIARRVVWIHLDPHVERPWERDGFKHDNLIAWVKRERPRLCWAFLVLCAHWIAKDLPSGGRKLGSFEGWAEVVGGILKTAGIPGFLDNLNQLYERSDTETTEWRELIQVWWWHHQDQPITSQQLFYLAKQAELLPGYMSKGEAAGKLRIGQQLKKLQDRIIGGYRIVSSGYDSHKKVNQYHLEAVREAPAPATNGNGGPAPESAGMFAENGQFAGIQNHIPATYPQGQSQLDPAIATSAGIAGICYDPNTHAHTHTHAHAHAHPTENDGNPGAHTRNTRIFSESQQTSAFDPAGTPAGMSNQIPAAAGTYPQPTPPDTTFVEYF
jgi:hypothetical protein